MAAFLLWNVDGKPLDALVQALVQSHSIDVVLLVEYDFARTRLSQMLQANGLTRRVSSERFGVFTRQGDILRRLPCRLGSRVNLWQWIPSGGQEGLLTLLHGHDRRNYDEGTRRIFFRKIVEAIERRERKQGHRRTLVAGDFNANPFDSSVASSDGLHAIGVRTIESATSRRVAALRRRADFFYNPMWRVYGQQPADAAGVATHFWVKNWAHELAWHMLDQVVLRPEEVASFPENELRIVTRVGGVSLVDVDGRPDRRTASDHLPIVFHWSL